MAFKSAAVAFLLCIVPGLPAQTVPGASLPPPVSEVLQQALGDFREGNFDAAIEKYQSVLQRDAASGAAYAGLARTYLKQDKVQEAFDTANKGVTAVPASLPAHTALAEVYFRQARMMEAEKEFLVGVNAGQPDARACLGLSRLYEAYSLHARARRMLERAHQIDPDDPEVQRRWLVTLNVKEQLEWLEKFLSSPNNEPEGRIRSLRTRLDVLKERLQQPRPNCRLVSKLTSTETQLKPMLIDPTHIHGFGLMVQVNGQSSKLLLDTGAGGLLINKKLAQKAGIEPVAASKFGGIGDKGDASGYVGYAKSIKIGDLEFQNCMVEVSEKRSVLDDDGLIGSDVFSHYLVTLDFLWQKMKLEELPQRPGEKAVPAALASHEQDAAEDEDTPSDQKKNAAGEAAAPAPAPAGPQDRYVAPEMQNYSKIFRFGHSLLIPTRVGNAAPKLFMIDTGAMMNTISPQAAREVTKVHGDDSMHVRGISGSVKEVFSADKAILQFSRFSQENQEMVAFDLSGISRSIGAEVSGLLGFTTLRQFTLKIDYRDGLVDFIYTGPKK
jgi:tetratricopeptide (TPR) repeat protein